MGVYFMRFAMPARREGLVTDCSKSLLSLQGPGKLPILLLLFLIPPSIICLKCTSERYFEAPTALATLGSAVRAEATKGGGPILEDLRSNCMTILQYSVNPMIPWGGQSSIASRDSSKLRFRNPDKRRAARLQPVSSTPCSFPSPTQDLQQ